MFLADPPFHLGALRNQVSELEEIPEGCHGFVPVGSSSLEPSTHAKDRHGRTLQIGDAVRVLGAEELYILEDLCESPEGTALAGVFPALLHTSLRIYCPCANLRLYPEGPHEVSEEEEPEL